MNFSRHPGILFAYIDIHLGPDSESRQVHARLNGETRTRDNSPLVVGFIVVHVGSGSVDISADRVSCSMNKVSSEPSVLDIASRHVINLESCNGLLFGNGALYELNGRIATAHDDAEYIQHL